MNRPAALWLAVGWGGFALLPWYGVEDGFWFFAWLSDYPAGPMWPRPCFRSSWSADGGWRRWFWHWRRR